MGDKSLVQPEGVHAGSADELTDRSADERGPQPDGDVRAGGRPDREPQHDELAADVDPQPDEGPELLGAPAVGPEGSDGQDDGNQ